MRRGKAPQVSSPWPTLRSTWFGGGALFNKRRAFDDTEPW